MAYYDEEGSEVEGILPPEEVTKLQEQLKTLEEKSKLAEELDGKLKAKEEELQKLSSKDFNFQKLRDKSQEEVETLKSKMNEKEKLLLTEVMELTKERAEEKSRRFNEAKEEVLRSLTGGDEGIRKSIELAEKELAGEAQTPKELEDRYRKAFILAKGEAPKKNPLFSGYSSSYREPDLNPRNFTETEEGKESLQKWFPDMAKKIIK